ncbi:hypothetical protein dqs_2525 [Azoarcus olearius]|uniref:tripartite tricarboxylate transporter TctB family protein n=1 Tax=Azoarcus sp. (strain BH72) TaxID=418699 RepID=UPI000806264D|nr:tripartite tricarboxylate transporter TctB family protein [Azoarcus olearius]ANQ85555.1 hypothetical protein dqs_2525 [Azoarcus olearius]
MQIRILSRRDSLAGLLFIAFGSVGGYLSAAYPLGSAMRMGAGYFPLLLSVVLGLLGIVVLLRSLAFDAEEQAIGGGIAWRAAAFVGGGVIAFALLAPHQGLLLATVVLTVLSGLAQREVRVRELLGLSAVLAVFGVAVFSYGLGLPLPVLPA